MPYWGFRIDVNCQDYPDYYVKELNERRVLRQGWGSDEGQNLRNLDQNNPPREQQANVRMFNVVKKGDYVLIPPDTGVGACHDSTRNRGLGQGLRVRH